MLSSLTKMTGKICGINIYYYATDIKLFFFAGVFMAQELFFLLTGHVLLRRLGILFVILISVYFLQVKNKP
jgi:hypothetical protein